MWTEDQGLGRGQCSDIDRGWNWYRLLRGKERFFEGLLSEKKNQALCWLGSMIRGKNSKPSTGKKIEEATSGKKNQKALPRKKIGEASVRQKNHF